MSSGGSSLSQSAEATATGGVRMRPGAGTAREGLSMSAPSHGLMNDCGGGTGGCPAFEDDGPGLWLAPGWGTTSRCRQLGGG